MQCFGLFGAELLQLRKTGSTEVFERQATEKFMIVAADLWMLQTSWGKIQQASIYQKGLLPAPELPISYI